jgi:hypothetical protein
MTRRYKKFLLFGAILTLILLLLPGQAEAQNFITSWLGDTAADFVGSLFSGFSYMIAWLIGSLVAVAGQLVDAMLTINQQILKENDFITIGWQIVRDIANLGFVLVIIVIAFATILRREQYGVTKLLPKLIAAAIIVNFSFAIAAAFINFTNILTDFFIHRATDGNVSRLSEYMAGSMGIHKFYLPEQEPEQEGGVPLPPGLGSEEDASLAGRFGASLLLGIAQIVFTTIFLLIALFVFLAFALMLLIRYIYITFLVIISPIVWLFWVVPALAGQFSKWWDKFLRWVFFAPALSFFIYLAFLSVEESAWQVRPYSGAFAAIITQGTTMIVLSGILIGGLIISQKMGIVGAAGALKVATKAGKGTRAWAGRQALRAGTLPLRNQPVRNLVQGMQRAGTGFGAGRLGQAGRFVTAPIRQLGKGLSTAGVVQGENLIKDAEERQKKTSDEQLALRVATMSNFDRVAALQRLAKNKNLDKVPNVARYISDPATKGVFASYGKEKEYGDIEKTLGYNTAMLSGKDEEGKPISIEDASIKFYATFSKDDLAKVQYNDMFQSKPPAGMSDTEHASLQKAAIHGIAKNNPGDIRKVFANVKSANIGNVKRAVEEVQKADADLAEDLEKIMKKAIGQRRMGELFDFESPGTTPPAASTS